MCLVGLTLKKPMAKVNSLCHLWILSHEITESFRLEKPSKINSPKVASNSCPRVPHLHGFCALKSSKVFEM